LDTEILVQKLAAHCKTLDQLHAEVQQTYSGNAAHLQEAHRNVPAQEECEEQDGFADALLLHRLQNADRQILPDTRQLIALLQAVLHNSPTGIAVVSGPDLVFRLANGVYRSLIPSPHTKCIGQPFREIWPTELGFDGENLIRQVLKRGQSLHFDRLELRFPNGLNHSFSVRICAMDWQQEEGALLLLQETTQSDRARQLAMEIAEETYHQAEELDTIINSMADAVILVDRNRAVVRANPAAIDLVGFDPVKYEMGDLIKALGTRYLDGSPVQAGDLPFEQALQGQVFSGEQLLIDNENGERIVRVSISPLFHETFVSGLITVWHDVTERERLLEQLEIEQSRLETIIEDAPQAIIVADEEGRIVLGNPAAERIFGRVLPYFQDFQKHIDLYICYTDSTPYDPRNLPLTCSALDGERLNNVEVQVRLPDGNIRHVVASTAPIVDRKGNLNGAVGVFQDITERKLAEETLRKQAARSQLLANLSHEFAEAGLHWQDLLNTIAEQVGKTLGDLCSVHLLEEKGSEQYLAAFYLEDAGGMEFIRSHMMGVHFPTNQGLTGQLIHSGQPLMLSELPIANIKNSIPFVDWSAAAVQLPETVSALVVPLRAHGHWVGFINLMRLQAENSYHEEDKIFLQDLAERAALAIENARLYEREAQRARELQALHQAATALLSTIDLETLLAEILSAAHNAIPIAEQGVIYLLSEKTGELEVRATFGCRDYQSCSEGLKDLAAMAVQEKYSLLFNEIKGIEAQKTAEVPEIKSAIIAPLMRPHNVLGALALFGAQFNRFSTSDVNLLDNFAATATAALQNATLYSEVQRLATTDTLTEQYNRRKFLELSELEIYRSRRFSTPLSAIMFDLDNFKEINDTLGHAAGDYVLHTVALRCNASIRVIDILGRYGGDEFAILLPDADMVEADEIAERIRQAVTCEPIHTSRGKVTITISLGVAQADHTYDTLASLLGRADSALYTAKQNGRNRVAKG
jgi:diguanylate cyclase (GGDEF)-like protein/PAS domain S-box-containing protein